MTPKTRRLRIIAALRLGANLDSRGELMTPEKRGLFDFGILAYDPVGEVTLFGNHWDILHAGVELVMRP